MRALLAGALSVLSGLPPAIPAAAPAALLAAGCAGFRARPQAAAPGAGISERAFPGFVAVVAREGDTFASLAARYLDDPSRDWFIAEFNESLSPAPGQEVIVPLEAYERGGLTLTGYRTVPILAYHKFSKTAADAMTVRESAFEEQMRFLKENGYRVITLDRLFDFIDLKAQVPQKAVVITIDDGWRSTYDIAYPILKRYGYPATLFVYTDFIFPSGRTLDWTLIDEMARNGVDVQCHTKTHRSLGKKEDGESLREYFETVEREVRESAGIIGKRLGRRVKYLAYPYGDTNELVAALLGKLGFRGALTVERGGNPFFVDRYRVGRSMIYGTFSLKEFENNLTLLSDAGLK